MGNLFGSFQVIFCDSSLFKVLFLENDVFFLSQETFNQVYDVAVTCYLYYPGDNHDYDIKLKHMNGHNKYLYDQERN